MFNVILIGPQGSGKGTQAEMIVREFGLTHIETGSIIRKRAQVHDKKAQIINHLANQKGVLLPDGIVLDMIYDELEEQKTEHGYLFDGFPRTVKQYLALKEFLKEKGLTLHAAVYLHISDEESIKRLTARRQCSVCNRGYSVLLEPERTACDCGGMLIKRPDDEPAAITKRLAAFRENTLPILNLIQKDGILKEINGEQGIEKISDDIRHHLKSLHQEKLGT